MSKHISNVLITAIEIGEPAPAKLARPNRLLLSNIRPGRAVPKPKPVIKKATKAVDIRNRARNFIGCSRYNLSQGVNTVSRGVMKLRNKKTAALAILVRIAISVLQIILIGRLMQYLKSPMV